MNLILDLIKAFFSRHASSALPTDAPPDVPHASPNIGAQPELSHVLLPLDHEPTAGDGFTPSFHKAFAKAMKWETGLIINFDDPEIQQGLINTPAQRKKVGYTDGVSGASVHDSGGETKFGVAQNAHRDIVVKNLTLAQAEAIYKHGYWDAVCGDQLHPDVARYVFDIGCGSGPRKGVLLLQRCVGVAEDGAMGPATISAANAKDPKALVWKLQQLRIIFYRSIVANNPSQSIFLQGWLNRANDI
jgi:hypothetical protein